jgi:hypothetical protein
VHVEPRSIGNTSSESKPTIANALQERYRYPEGFLEFRVAEGLPRESEYFQFGPETTCYGRHVEGGQPSGHLSRTVDVLPSVFLTGTQVVLPFDPDEVIDNLRLERYAATQESRIDRLLKEIYYRLRPLTSRWLRKHIQRLRAGNWQAKQFPHWPVDTSVEDICEKLLALSIQAAELESIPFVWFWPDGARGCVSMTHDVETEAGRDFCEQLMEIDESYGIKSSFQIVPEGRYLVSPEFLSRIRERGFEVCVQDLNHDGRLFDRRAEFLRRVARINEYGKDYAAKGYRSAVLYRNAEWYKDLHFSYDMSFPNVAHLDPQPGGCCTVMPYFIGDILELPLTTVQDYTLLYLLNERSINLWKTQMEIILSKNGLASFIVHPDYILEPEKLAVYQELLAMFSTLRKTEHLWFALPGEIDTWWRARNRMSVVRDGSGWRIEGEGAERAVLAFAKLVDGELIYELSEPSERVIATSSASRIHSKLAVKE